MSERSSPPRVFVSYSDDSAGHAKRVLELAQWLRSHGVDAQLDQFEESPEEGWPAWVYRQIREAEYVLVIATPGYLRRSEGDEPRASVTDSAAKFGSHLSLQELHEAGGRNRKFIPVLYAADAVVESVPLPLRGATCYRLPDQRDDLYRRLTGQPKVLRAPLGVLKTFDDESLYDSVDENTEFGLRARASLDEQLAEDSLRAVIDAGLRDEPELERPRPRWRRSWLQTNRQWVIGAAAFGVAFMAVGLLMGNRVMGPDASSACRIQLTNGDGSVVEGIEQVILKLPSGDEVEVVVEDGRTLKFACLASTVQVQAHVFLGPNTELATSDPDGDVPSNGAGQLGGSRIDGRVALPALGAGEDEIVQARLVQIVRTPPLEVEPPPVDQTNADPKPTSYEPTPKPDVDVGGAKPQLPSSLKPTKRGRLTASSGDRQLGAKLDDSKVKAELLRCYERGLVDDPTLRGTVSANVRISPSGDISEVELISQLADPDVGKCITKLIDGWTLSERENPRGVVARVTIELAPS